MASARTTASAGGFDGLAGRIAARVMARVNRDMESAAVEELDAAPNERVLSIGFGPGEGVALLARRLTAGLAAGVDPAEAMLRHALRRNRPGVDSGRVDLRKAGAEEIPWPDDAFDGVIAVNSIQLWRPLDAGVREVARTLRPGGRFVALTHTWALARERPVSEWIDEMSEACGGLALRLGAHDTRRYRSGAALLFSALSQKGTPVRDAEH